MLLVGAGLAFAVIMLAGSLSAERVRGWIDGVGLAGPVVFVLLGALLSLAFVPGPLLAGAAGLLFGTLVGTPVALGSATLGSILACLLARAVAGDAIEALAGPRVRALARWVGRRGFVSVLYARLAPGVPFHSVSYASGLTTIPVLVVAGATAVGAVPRTFAYVALGGSLGDLRSPEAIAALVVIVVMGAIGLLLVRRDVRRERARAAAAPTGAWEPDVADA